MYCTVPAHSGHYTLEGVDLEDVNRKAANQHHDHSKINLNSLIYAERILDPLTETILAVWAASAGKRLNCISDAFLVLQSLLHYSLTKFDERTRRGI